LIPGREETVFRYVFCLIGEDNDCFIYANSEPQPNAKYSCAASVAIAR